MKGAISYYWALWRMGKLPPERIPDVACDALQEGMDNPLLRQLAGLDRPTRRELGTKFDDACQQLGVIPDTEEYVEAEFKAWLQTALPIAHTLAKDILGGTIDPVRGWLNLPWRNDQPLGQSGSSSSSQVRTAWSASMTNFISILCLLVKDFFSSRKENA